MADLLTQTTALQERLLAATMARQPNLVKVEPTHRLAQPLQKALAAPMRVIVAPRELQVLIPSRMALQRLALAVQKQPLVVGPALGLAVDPMRAGAPLQAQTLIKVPEDLRVTPAPAQILAAIQDQLLTATPVAQMVIMALAEQIRLQPTLEVKAAVILALLTQIKLEMTVLAQEHNQVGTMVVLQALTKTVQLHQGSQTMITTPRSHRTMTLSMETRATLLSINCWSRLRKGSRR